MPRVASRLAMDQWRAKGRTEIEVAGERVDEVLAAGAGRGPPLSDEQLMACKRSAAWRGRAMWDTDTMILIGVR